MDRLIKYADDSSTSSSDGFSQSSLYKEFIHEGDSISEDSSILHKDDYIKDIDAESCYATEEESEDSSSPLLRRKKKRKSLVCTDDDDEEEDAAIKKFKEDEKK